MKMQFVRGILATLRCCCVLRRGKRGNLADPGRIWQRRRAARIPVPAAQVFARNRIFCPRSLGAPTRPTPDTRRSRPPRTPLKTLARNAGLNFSRSLVIMKNDRNFFISGPRAHLLINANFRKLPAQLFDAGASL